MQYQYSSANITTDIAIMNHTHCRRLCKTTKIFVTIENVFFYLIFTLTHIVFGFLIFVYSSAKTTIDIALMNHTEGYVKQPKHL